MNEIKHEKVMLCTKDVCQIMGIGRDRGYELMGSKQFPTVKVGRKVMVHKEVFDKWLKGEKLTNSRRF